MGVVVVVRVRDRRSGESAEGGFFFGGVLFVSLVSDFTTLFLFYR